MQTFVGFVLAMVSVVNIAGDFKEIRAGIELGKRTWEHARNRPSFYVYNHRGKAFSPGVASNAITIIYLICTTFFQLFFCFEKPLKVFFLFLGNKVEK